GIEQPAELADLIPAPCELPVEVVADPAEHEDGESPPVVLREDQPQEHGHAGQASHAQDVRNGENSVGLNPSLLDLHPGASTVTVEIVVRCPLTLQETTHVSGT